MRIAGSIITAICGIVVVVSIFLNWIDMGSFGWGAVTLTGWNCIDASVGDFMHVLLVMIGGILMAVFAISAFIVSLAAKGGKAAVVTLSIFAIVGALLAIGGSAWFMIDAAADSAFSVVAYGVWIALAGAVVGFIFAILTAAFSKGKQDW
jgi:hypothetical protein